MRRVVFLYNGRHRNPPGRRLRAAREPPAIRRITMPQITRDQVKVPVDVAPEMRDEYNNN